MTATVENVETKVQLVLYEGEGSAVLTGDERFEIISALVDKGYNLTRLNGSAENYQSDGSSVVVIGKFADSKPPQVVQLENAAQFQFIDITGRDVTEMLADVEQTYQTLETKTPGGWKPWFPVIDFDRCTNCMQCLSFCLFDVYAVDEKDMIKVQNQSKCKTDCPACSRVCPEVAILFPKYNKGPINGDVVREADIQREAMKVDVSSLLGGDIYKALRERQSDARQRFSTERDESRALLERKKCLKKLQGDLDIPDEVLMSLPSIGDIHERAERAKAKAVVRRERSQTVKDDQKRTPTTEEWGI